MNTYPQKIVVLDLTRTEKIEYRKERAPGEWPLEPFSFERFKKTKQEKEQLKQAKINWNAYMKRLHPEFTKKKGLKLNQRGI